MQSDISPDMTVKDLLEQYPELTKLFVEKKMLCAGCPAEAFHTLADAAKEYGLHVDEIVQRITRRVHRK